MKASLKKEMEKVVKKFDGVSADNISYLIQSRERYYIVYLDIENDLDWYLTDKGEKQLNKKKYWPLQAKINCMLHKPCVNQMSKKMKKQYKCLLGNALILAMENKYEDAEKCIQEANNYIEEREYEITRRWNAEICIIIFAILIGLYYWGNKEIFNGSERKYSNYLCFGSIGVLLSILQHNAYINAKCTAGIRLVICEIVSKYIVGMVSALIVVIAFKTGIFMNGFVTTKYEEQFVILIGIVSGFSERLAPSLIGKIEGKDENANEKENSNNI